MFEYLDDPNPPDFGATALSRVERHCQKRQRRTRVGAISAVTVPSLALGGLLLSRATADAPERVVTSQPDVTANPTTVPIVPVITTAEEIAITTPISTIATMTTEPEPEFPLLGDRDTTLGPEEWLLPLDLPDGYEQRGGSVTYQFGFDPAEPPQADNRVLVRSIDVAPEFVADDGSVDLSTVSSFGLLAGTVRIEISEVDYVGWSVVGGPLSEHEIGGVQWRTANRGIDGAGREHRAQRNVGGSSVVVQSFGDLSESEFQRIVAGLAIVPRSTLSEPIVDPWNTDTVEVVAYEAFGEPVSVRLQTFDDVDDGQGGRWMCRYELRDLSYSTHCGPDPFVGDVMTGAELHNAHHNQVNNELEVSAYGLVRDDVDRVDLVMFSGEIVTVRPQTFVEELDRYVWVMVDSFPIGQRLDQSELPVLLPPTIVSITAFDIAGNELAVDLGYDWRDDEWRQND